MVILSIQWHIASQKIPTLTIIKLHLKSAKNYEEVFNFNSILVGNVDDTEIMVEHIKRKFPNNFIGLAGFSAGSAQVISYIGQKGEKVKVTY